MPMTEPRRFYFYSFTPLLAPNTVAHDQDPRSVVKSKMQKVVARPPNISCITSRFGESPSIVLKLATYSDTYYIVVQYGKYKLRIIFL